MGRRRSEVSGFGPAPYQGAAVVNQTLASPGFGPAGFHPHAFGPEGRRAPLALVSTAKNPHLSTAVGCAGDTGAAIQAS